MTANPLELITPNESETSLARESSLRLAPLLKLIREQQGNPRIQLISDDAAGKPMELPPRALELLRSILDRMGQGKAVIIHAVDHELSTQEAANLLNVSRPYLIRLLDEGKIPHRKVGKHRRVCAADLLDYKRKTDTQRHAALDELAEQSQELNMGY